MRMIGNHIPKVGGLTFRAHLERIYGKENVFHDYTHCGRPDYEEEGAPSYLLNKLRRVNKTTVIYGHILMMRYADIPGAHFIGWMRNPVDRVLSHYYYWLKAPDPDDPYCNKLIEDGLSVLEFSKLMPNEFSRRFSPLNIDDFCFMGIFEKYNESLMLFYDMFSPNIKLDFDTHENKNYARGTGYRLSVKQRKEIEKINSVDMHIYKKALERFDMLKRKYKGGF